MAHGAERDLCRSHAYTSHTYTRTHIHHFVLSLVRTFMNYHIIINLITPSIQGATCVVLLLLYLVSICVHLILFVLSLVSFCSCKPSPTWGHFFFAMDLESKIPWSADRDYVEKLWTIAPIRGKEQNNMEIRLLLLIYKAISSVSILICFSPALPTSSDCRGA